MVIPSIDRVCTQLFKQLNDQFKEGLTQFMAQVRMGYGRKYVGIEVSLISYAWVGHSIAIRQNLFVEKKIISTEPLVQISHHRSSWHR